LKPEFPQIKVRSKDVKNMDKVRRLRKDLMSLKKDILFYTPSNFGADKLSRLRIRIFRISRTENCGELFIYNGNRRYVCLNSNLVNSAGYYTALQHVIHGIAHSFCYIQDDIAEEIFCEYVSYEILQRLLEKRGKRFAKRIMKNMLSESHNDYNDYYRAAKKLEKTRRGKMVQLNVWAKNRKISKKNQRKILYKLLKVRKYRDDETSDNLPELETGFRKVR
jgi:hypothetical protein